MQFELQGSDPGTKARAGLLTTAHGEVETPAFMPVGTNATVKTLTPDQLWNSGARLILANAYHLYLRPGLETIRAAGGIHRFANWSGSVLTDSGGYQVFSLADLRKVDDDGVRFQSHLDGSRHFFTPESVIDLERALGSDIVMPLDECPPSNADESTVRGATRRTIEWAERARNHFENGRPLHGYDQSLFLIVQGGVNRELRVRCAEAMVTLDVPGYAIGGLAVGEPNSVMYEVTDWVTEVLPFDKPRYLMGVGTPRDLLESIARGIDMFDCVLPTRNARNGQLFTRSGKINIRNARWKSDFSPIDPETNSYASTGFSRAYLHHLFNANEVLGLTLATLHNVSFYEELVRDARAEIMGGTFADWKAEFIAGYGAPVPK